MQLSMTRYTGSCVSLGRGPQGIARVTEEIWERDELTTPRLGARVPFKLSDADGARSANPVRIAGEGGNGWLLF